MASIVRHSLNLLVSQVGATGLSFLASILMARIIQPEGMGKWALYNAALSLIVTILSLSISNTLIYFINSKKIPVGKIISTLLFYILGVTIVLFFILIVIKKVWNLDWMYPANFQSEKYIFIICIMFVNSFMATLASIIFYAFEKFKFQGIILLITPIFNIIVYSLYYLGYIKPFDDPFLLPLYSNCFIGVLNLILIYQGYRVLINIPIKFVPLAKEEIVTILNASFYTYLATIFQFLSFRVDYWFINFYSTKDQLGIYALGTQVAQLLWILPGAVTQVIYSKLASIEDEEYALRNLEQTIKICIYLFIPICIFFIISINYLLPIIYGANYSKSISVIGILIFGIFPYTIPLLMNSYFMARGLFKVNTYSALIGLVVSLISYSLLVPKFGIYGGAVGSVLSYSSNSIFYIIYLKRKANDFSLSNVFFLKKKDFEFIGLLIKEFRI